MLLPIGYAHVCLIFDGGGLRAGGCVTFGVDTSASSEILPADIAGTILGVIDDTDLADFWHEDISLVEVRVKLGPHDSGPTGSAFAAIAGTNTGDGGSPATTTLVKKQTALGGRHGRGRMYFPTPGETPVDAGGILSNAFRDSRQLDIGAFHLGLVGADLPMVILHNDATDPTLVSGLVLDAKIATQRRRLRK